MEHLACRRLGDAQLVGNRGVAFSAGRANQRGALAVGQGSYRSERGSEVGTSVDFAGAAAVLPLVIQLLVKRSSRGELGQRDIARDAVQPRTQLAHLYSRAQRLHSADECLLHGIFRLVIA